MSVSGEGRRERGSVVVRRELMLVDGGGDGGVRRRWGLRAWGTIRRSEVRGVRVHFESAKSN